MPSSSRSVPSTVLILAASGLVALAAPARAGLYDFTFKGTIGVPAISNDGGFFDSTVKAGTPFTASFLLNYPSHDYDADPNRALYLFNGSPFGFTATFGDMKYLSTAQSSGSVSVGNNQPTAPTPTDYVLFGVGGGALLGPMGAVGGVKTTDLSAGLADSTETVLSSDALPLSYDLSRYDQGTITSIYFTVDNGPSYLPGYKRSYFYATINSINVAAVPEPSAIVLIALGLLPLGLIAAKRRSRG